MKKILFLLVLLCAIAQGTWAQEPYITDVIVIGDDDSGDADDKYHDYERAGWIGKVRDLNDGAGGHYIYMMYKMNTSTGSSGTPISDFYLWAADSPGPASLTHMGRTYYRVGCDGDSDFRNSGGDLNCEADGKWIHLYYTKDATSPVRINFIQFDNQPYSPCNAVGLNGTTTACNLNMGAGGDIIYMHVYKYLSGSPAEIYTENQLCDAVAITPGAPSVKLMNDINLSRNFVIGDIEHDRAAIVTLDLNGHTLNRGLNSSIDLGSVIRVEPKSSLTINDSSDNPDTPEYDGTGTITGGYTNQDGGGIVNHGTLTINGANIKGNTARGNGGGVFTGKLSGDYYGSIGLDNWPEVHINGGVIENCSSDGNGGGFCHGIVDGTRFGDAAIKNCIIRNNVSKKLGGGLYNECLRLEVTNCTISGNTAFDTGGIYNGWGGFSLNGCTVTGNKGTDGAGGIANETTSANMTVSDCTVTNNFAGTRGGGVWNGNNGTLNVVGSTITGNTAASTGGGIYNNATLKMEGNTVVSGNSGETSASNLYLDADTKIELTGAFTDGAHIGVNPAYKTAIITSGYGTHNGTTDPNTIFFSDIINTSFSLNDNGEAVQNFPTSNWIDYRAESYSNQSSYSKAYDKYYTIYIENEAEFALMAYNVNNTEYNSFNHYTFILNKDLDMSAHYWTPIGAEPNYRFEGNFNGNGHTISGIYVNSEGPYNGLFGLVAGSSDPSGSQHKGCDYIKNFVLKDSYIKGGNYTGGVVGFMFDGMTLENVFCQADVTGGSDVGGIVGKVESFSERHSKKYVTTINNCLYLSGTVSATGNRAAVIGTIVKHYDDLLSLSNNYYIDPASYIGNDYDVCAYPITASLPEGVTVSYTLGVPYNGIHYHPAGTVNLTVRHDLTQIVTSVKVNGDELVGSEGNYTFTIDPTAIDPYELNVTVSPSPIAGSGTQANPYLIDSQEDWNFIADYLNSGQVSNNFSGVHFQLAADDVTIGQRMGTYDHPFCGTFDGDGRTLTLAFGSAESYSDQECAPFYRINNATIRNLVVAGSIYSSAQHNAGIAARAMGKNNRIQNCVSNVSIHSNRSGSGDDGDCTNGGFIGMLNIDDTHVYFNGCAFTGELLGACATNWGGFVGWAEYPYPGCYLYFTDCLFAPTTVDIATPDGSNSRTFCRRPNLTGYFNHTFYINCYYTTVLQAADGGKQAYSTATAPANIGEATTGYGFITAYANGLKCGEHYFMAPEAVSLADNADNSTTLTEKDGYLASVTLTGRTLFNDSEWNTLCLPFDLTLEGSLLEGAEARTLNEATFNDGTLTLNFGEPVGELTAGTPYIIRWSDGSATEKDDIVNPVFNSVIINAADPISITPGLNAGTEGDGSVTFLGTYDPVTIGEEGDNTKLYFSTDNTLYWPNGAMTFNPFRAYLQLNTAVANIRAYQINFGEDETTAISLIDNGQWTMDNGQLTIDNDAWYTIDGRKLDGKPTQRGIYIHGGRTVVKN